LKVKFNDQIYQLVITDHAQMRMKQRAVDEDTIIEILKSGKVKPKNQKNKFWVYRKLSGRLDNLVCLSISIENPVLLKNLWVISV